MTKKLLIIEDDEKVLQDISDCLTFRRDLEIRTARHGEEGLTLVNIFSPDLIILDIMLPEIDGFEICNRIKEIPVERRPKIILLTILTTLLNKMESDWLHKTGAYALLPKPVDFSQLVSYVDEILQKT